MTKAEKRKLAISNLKVGINATQKALRDVRAGIILLEEKLDNKRSELRHQMMLLKFDQIDELRQHVSDIIAANKWKSDGHIDELEQQEKQ